MQRRGQHKSLEVARVPAEMFGGAAKVVQDELVRLRKLADHPNRVCHYDQLLAAHLLGFWDSAVRSLRTFDARSSTSDVMKAATDDIRLARSTVSDAMNQLPAAALLPLMQRLLGRLPDCSNPQLADLMTLKKRICAIDGSYFRVPADVLWGLAHLRSNGKTGRQVRLDLHLDVLRFVPEKAEVNGHEKGSESGAFAGTLEADRVYLADRNFVDFAFLRAVIAKGSDFVVRLRKNTNLTVLATRELTAGDKTAGVLSDRLVAIEGSRWAAGVPGTLREVVVFDPVKQQPVRLLTTLLEAPAELIGRLYRHRWVIELFFRWLKCVAKVKHLFCESQNGITMQFYVMIIATLLAHLHGHRASVYTNVLLASAAAGDLRQEKVSEVLERVAREREQERLRRLKKKAK